MIADADLEAEHISVRKLDVGHSDGRLSSGDSTGDRETVSGAVRLGLPRRVDVCEAWGGRGGE